MDAPPNVGEAGLLGLETRASDRISVPRLSDPPIAMECRLSRIIDHGDGPGVSLVFGEILCWQIRDGLRNPDGRIPAHKLFPLSRLGGRDYAGLGAIFSLPRPKWDPARETPVTLGRSGGKS